MKKYQVLYLCIILFICIAGCNKVETSNKYGKYQGLPFGAIKPTGWIHNQINRDLEIGLTGHFDDFGKTVTNNVFVHSNRISAKMYDGTRGWWMGEHEGYWKDGVLRGAFLTNNSTYKEKATAWVKEILDSIDSTGYIGIYRKEDRYNHLGENGELWTQSRIIMPLIAYYEYTGDTNVLNAIEKSAQLTISKYSKKTPWIEGSGGISHGVGYFETLEWLYKTTGKKEYAEFSAHLYEDFCKAEMHNNDMMKQHLLDSSRKFIAHGAHIAEGFFVPWYIAEITKSDTMQRASKLAMDKLRYHSAPAGAMVCSEDVWQLRGSSDHLFEYCANTEFLNPLGIVFRLTGDYAIGDMIENKVFNALQGNRLPDLKALIYLGKENLFHMDTAIKLGCISYDANYKAASCCVLNGGRVMPYYVQNMWQKDKSGNSLIALLYGPNEVTIKINGRSIKINEITDYPFSDEIKFEVKPQKKTKFDLVLRKPFGCESMDITGISEKHIQNLEDRVIISKNWGMVDEFTLKFNFNVEYKNDSNKIYLQRGPLVYALPFPYLTDTIRTHENENFHQLTMNIKDTINHGYCIDTAVDFVYKKIGNNNYDYPFDMPLMRLDGYLNLGNETKEVHLVPLGNTVIRTVSFPMSDK